MLYPEIFTNYDVLSDERGTCLVQKKILQRELDVLKQTKNPNAFPIVFNKTEPNEELSDIEKYCILNFKQVDKFAYKDKGIFKDKRYPMYMNELIQPDLKIIEEVRNSIKKPESVGAWALSIASIVDKMLTYTGDGGMDNWQDIYATVLGAREDCENHAALVSSIEPEFCICAGWAGDTYHAWNGFVLDGKLWCIETNSTLDQDKNSKIFLYEGQEFYKMHWIFTKNKTFRCVSKPVHFGIIVR